MKIYKIIIIVLIIVLLGGVGYYFISKYSKTSSSTDIKNIKAYDGNKTTINLDNLTYDGTGLTIDNNTIYIAYGGVYELSGTTTSTIVVDVEDDKDVNLILNNVNIKSNEVPIYIKNGNTYITLEGTSYIEYTKTYDENEEVDAAIYSSDDLYINGTGSLEIKSNYTGIVSKDTLTIEDGSYIIDSYDDGINVNDIVTINNGNFTITAKDDAIHADGLLEINNGTYKIIAAEGLEATYVKINNGTINIEASDDGINAGNKSDDYSVIIEINNGDITIKMGAGDTDGIDSNGDLYINGGTIDVTCNSPFDYDGKAEYNGGTLIVNGNVTNTITNQMMGGPGMMPGMMPMQNNQNMQRRR